jgi:drug/metabolite transporter (DMT)-like permease
MHERAIVLVLLSALLHATWNAQLKGCKDRTRFMATMSIAMGALASICVPFVPLPTPSSWVCIAISAVLHICYNLLLLENYKKGDFGSAYPIARGISPLLVTLGAILLMRQRPTSVPVAAIAIISMGIVFLSTERAKAGKRATFSALATGVSIAAYTVVDGMGVQRSQNTISYTVWVFASYLLMPVILMLLKARGDLAKMDSMPRPIGAAMFSLSAYALVLWATHYVDVGIVSALRETSVLWAVIISRVFLGEAFTWRRLSSALMICLGVILLIARWN